MERVAQLLDPSAKGFSPRQALLRLWVLAADQVRLNRWEQGRDKAGFDERVERFLQALSDEEAIPANDIEAQPLALIRALDDWLATMARPAGRGLAVGNPATSLVEDGRGWWLVPLAQAQPRRTAIGVQVTQHALWFRRHVAIPCQTQQGLDLTLKSSSGRLDEALAGLGRVADSTLRVWLAHFDDGADVVWTRAIGPAGNWRTLSVQPSGQRTESILSALREADACGALVVVFPEFTVDLQQRQAIVDQLSSQPVGSVQLVVAGSFHEPTNPDEPLIAFNTAPVLACNGAEVFKHSKLRLFGNEHDGAECAEIGNRLDVLLTPVGCMTVMICKDYMDADDRVHAALHQVPVDWIWVPSYGNETTLKAHKARAKHLAQVQVGLSTAVAQTQNTAMKAPGVEQALLPGFGHGAGTERAMDVGTQGGVVAFSANPWATPAPDGSAAASARRTLKRVK
jgi:hypothetical protein